MAQRDYPQTTRMAQRSRRGTLRKPAHLAGAIEEPGEASPVILGRYRIVESRATGGFGTVEVCWDTRLQRRVAIKCMPLYAQGTRMVTSTVQEALAEARTSCMLAHPNIVTVFDFEADENYAYLVMEYVDGVNLAELLQRIEGGVLTADECAHILDSIADALDFAHDNYVLHLDIKPANIMIDRSGTVKLGDFGMAALASAAGYADARGGTVGYMPPEQITGELVDERCDLFSLAVVTLQSLTGKNPFAAKSAEESLGLIEKGGTGKRSIDKLVKDLPIAVADEINSALEPDPAYRSPSVADFADAVVPALGDPKAGQASFQALLGQLADDELDAYSVSGPRISLTERAPWLEGALVRIMSGAFCAWLGWNIAPSLALIDPTLRLAPMAIGALAGLLLPVLGSALVVFGSVAAVVAGAFGAMGSSVPSTVTILGIPGQQAIETVNEVAGETAGGVASEILSIGATGIVPAIQPHIALGIGILVAIVLGGWWLAHGRFHDLASSALLAPAASLIPYAGVPIAALGLSPAAAGVTTLLAWFVYRVAAAATVMGISAQTVWVTLTQLPSHPTLLIEGAGFALTAAAASFLAHRGSRGLAVLGSCIGFAGVIASSMLRARVENGGIWVAPNGPFIAVALLLFILMDIAVAVFGAPLDGREDAR